MRRPRIQILASSPACLSTRGSGYRQGCYSRVNSTTRRRADLLKGFRVYCLDPCMGVCTRRRTPRRAETPAFVMGRFRLRPARDRIDKQGRRWVRSVPPRYYHLPYRPVEGDENKSQGLRVVSVVRLFGLRLSGQMATDTSGVRLSEAVPPDVLL